MAWLPTQIKETMGFKIAGTTIVVIIALSAAAAPALALVTNTPGGGRIGYLPLNEASPANGATPIHSTVPTGEPPLEWNGGPVMHSQVAYAIFWAPSGYAFPSGYKAGIESFLKNVAADSRKSTDVYSVSAQYSDGTGNAAYVDTFGGSVTDTTAYPTAVSGSCSPYVGFGESFSACVSDQKMAAEVDAVVTAQGWPRGLGAEYYVVLPPHAGSCFEATGDECFDLEFCAYHNYSETADVVYSNISYSPGDVEGCGVGQYPNGHANGNLDDTLSSLSHEANESITDPTLEAWYDEEGFENGDECRNTPFEEDFGSPLGGSEEAETLFNQSIAGAHYYLQQEWSNNLDDCAQRVEPAEPVINSPAQLAPGQSATFDGSASLPGESGIVSYGWNFGDGGTASGPAPSHAFASPGVYPVTLTLEDEWGLQYSATRQQTVAAPSSSPPRGSIVTPSSPGVGPITVGGAAKKGLTCKKGQKKARKHGKLVCLKVKKKHGKHRRG